MDQICQNNINQSLNIIQRILKQQMISQIRIFEKFNPNIERGKLKACQICSAKFNVFTPEHQCKRCLRAVCSSCAGNKRQVYKQGMSKAPHRLCKFCNTQSSILVQFVSTNKLRFGKDSQIGRKWHKLIPKSSAQSSSFKQYKKFNIETFNQLWDSYNFSLRQFVGLLTFSMEQGSVYMQINNVYTQLQSRGVSEKFQNVILMILFVLCFAGADVCTDLVEFLCSLKKTVIDQKQILQGYLNTLSISQQQSKKINDYINYKYKQFVGPMSINAVTAECSIHVISKAFEKQRIDQVFMLLAIVLQMNFDMLNKNKGNKSQCDYQMLRDCDMSIYMGKFKTLGNVDIAKNKLPLNEALKTQKGQIEQNQQTRIIQKPSRKQSNHSAGSTPPKPSYQNRANRQTIQPDFVNDEQFIIPVSRESLSQSFVSDDLGGSKGKGKIKNNQSFEEGLTQLKLSNNGKKFSYNQSPIPNNILGSLTSEDQVQRTKSSYVLSNNDETNMHSSRTSIVSQPVKQGKKQGTKKQLPDLNLSKIMKELGKKNSVSTVNILSELEPKKSDDKNMKSSINSTTNNNSPQMKKQISEPEKSFAQKQAPKIIYNENYEFDSKGSPTQVITRGRTPTVQAQGRNEMETRTRTTTVQQEPGYSGQSELKLRAELKELQQKLIKNQQQLQRSGQSLKVSQNQVQSLKKQLNQTKSQYQISLQQKKQLEMQLSLQKSQSNTNSKKEQNELQTKLKIQLQQQLGSQKKLQVQLVQQQKYAEEQNTQIAKLKQQLQQMTQKNNSFVKEQEKYLQQYSNYRNEMEQLKISNRLMKDKLQQNSLGIGNKNSKRDQSVEEINKINELMQKNLENKNKQIQSLSKKNKQLALQLQEYTRVNKNSQIQAEVEAEAEQKNELAKKLKKENELLIKKMQQLGDRVVKEEGEKLQISSELFELKQRQRSYSMVLEGNNETPTPQNQRNSLVQSNPQVKNNKAKPSQCLIF